MNEQSRNSIFVRDGDRQLCWPGCEQWDRLTMLAALSSDPRSIDELAVAWSRYRPAQPLLELGWQRAESPPSGNGRLWIDLTLQRYSWDKPREVDSLCAAYQFDDGPWRPGDPLIWLNLPPWWRGVSAARWPGSTQSNALDVLRAIDFRGVLYGRAMLESIAKGVLSQNWKGMRPLERTRRGAEVWETGFDAHSEVDLTSELSDVSGLSDPSEDLSDIDATPAAIESQAQWYAAVNAIHVRWLMTPRADLGGKMPRQFLHLDREWKDRELEFRRAQWSRMRQAPTAVPRWSHMFLKGPMGSEEVICYFDLCREMVSAAWRWVDDDHQILLPTLVDDLEEFMNGWLDSQSSDGEGSTPRQIIDGERSLVPREAGGGHMHCDCPLCRVQAQKPELFGPAFLMFDGYHPEMEREFAFSLHEDRKSWEASCDEWLSWDDPTDDDSDSSKASRGNRSSRATAAGADWSDVWESSYVDLSITSPRLSMLGIGARLGEIVSDLKRCDAEPTEVEQANKAFDELGRVVGEWLLADSPPGDSKHQQSMETAAQHMIEKLEAIAMRHPELTNKSADLQSLVHQWQRQLTAQPGG